MYQTAPIFAEETESPKKSNVSRGSKGVILIFITSVEVSHMKTTNTFWYF